MTARFCMVSIAFGAHRERNGQWRSDCPVPGCGASRALELDAPGKHVRWKTWCSDHDKEATAPYLIKLIGPCMPGKRSRTIDRDELAALALTEMPPTSLRLAMLEMAGWSTRDALDALGVRREHRSRVIAGRAPILVQKPR